MLEKYRRQLTDDECRWIEEQRQGVTRQLQRLENVKKGLLAGFLIVPFVGWLLSTLMPSILGWLIACVGAGGMYVHFRKVSRQRQQLKTKEDHMLHFILRKEAEVTRCESKQVFRFEMGPGQLPMYGFQVSPEEVFFVQNVRAERNPNFPNADFEVLSSYPYSVLVTCNAYAIHPKKNLRPKPSVMDKIPTHLQILRGHLEDFININFQSLD